ncbi:hypothetical protein JOC78_001472 [Bacillus ectoiniformans]|nr:hypothetical protein [Bacillus ectoiniformans]
MFFMCEIGKVDRRKSKELIGSNVLKNDSKKHIIETDMQLLRFYDKL